MMPGGMVYATVPAYTSLWSAEDESAGHFRRYSRKRLSERFDNAGFQVTFASYFFGPLPIPIAILRSLPWRLGLRKSPTAATAWSHHGASFSVIRSCAEKLLSFEARAIRERRALPFGSSCLVAARRC
jgi:hypothetical protein